MGGQPRGFFVSWRGSGPPRCAGSWGVCAGLRARRGRTSLASLALLLLSDVPDSWHRPRLHISRAWQGWAGRRVQPRVPVMTEWIRRFCDHIKNRTWARLLRVGTAGECPNGEKVGQTGWQARTRAGNVCLMFILGSFCWVCCSKAGSLFPEAVSACWLLGAIARPLACRHCGRLVSAQKNLIWQEWRKAVVGSSQSGLSLLQSRKASCLNAVESCCMRGAGLDAMRAGWPAAAVAATISNLRPSRIGGRDPKLAVWCRMRVCPYRIPPTSHPPDLDYERLENSRRTQGSPPRWYTCRNGGGFGA